MVIAFKLNSWSMESNFCAKGKIRSRFIFPYGYLFYLVLFIKKTSLSSLNWLGAFKINWADMCRSICKLSICCIDLFLVFTAVVLLECVKLGSAGLPNISSFSKLFFHVNFRIRLSISSKFQLGSRLIVCSISNP